jgi:hypothetical protein
MGADGAEADSGYFRSPCKHTSCRLRFDGHNYMVRLGRDGSRMMAEFTALKNTVEPL